MEAFRAANSSPGAFQPAAPASSPLVAPAALFANPSGPVKLLAFDEMAAQPGLDEQDDALEGDPRAHAMWSLLTHPLEDPADTQCGAGVAPAPSPPICSTSQENAATPSEASSPAAVGEAGPSHGGQDIDAAASCEGGTQVSVIRTRRLRCKQLGTELASALPCVTDLAPCFRAEAVERSDAAGGCMAVALDDA